MVLYIIAGRLMLLISTTLLLSSPFHKEIRIYFPSPLFPL